MSATDRQVGGNHYNKHEIQPWHIIDEYNLNFYEGCILKYLLRRKGDRVEDLEKLIHTAEKEIENVKREDISKRYLGGKPGVGVEMNLDDNSFKPRWNDAAWENWYDQYDKEMGS